MLTGITLENFKAFKEPQFIPIKPITLVFGQNSAGKSSIVHALAFLKYVHMSNGHCDPENVEYGSDKFHLGSWHNLVHGHNATATMRITLHYDRCSIMWAFKNCDHGPRVDSFVLCKKEDNVETPIARGTNSAKAESSPSIMWAVELHAEHPFWGCLMKEIWDVANRKSSDTNNIRNDLRKKVFIDRFNLWVGNSWKQIPEPSQDGTYYEYMANLLPGLSEDFFEPGHMYWSTFNQSHGLPELSSIDGEHSSLNQHAVDAFFLSLSSTSENKDRVDHLLNAFLDQTGKRAGVHSGSLIPAEYIDDMLLGRDGNPLTKPRHVGAFRSTPKTKLTRNNIADKPDLRAWFHLMYSPDTNESINEFIKTLKIPYTIAIRKIVHSAFYASRFTPLDFWSERKLDHAATAEVIHSDEELVFLDANNHAHPILSLGSGIGVILPVLVSLAADNDSLLSIEEPECHIHPKLQAELGDIVIQTSLRSSSTRTYIETHSEHLILRILRRIRETTEKDFDDWPDALKKACPDGIKPDDVAVLYVEPGENGAIILEMPLDANGEFTRDWPHGFFEERMKEIF